MDAPDNGQPPRLLLWGVTTDRVLCFSLSSGAVGVTKLAGVVHVDVRPPEPAHDTAPTVGADLGSAVPASPRSAAESVATTMNVFASLERNIAGEHPDFVTLALVREKIELGSGSKKQGKAAYKLRCVAWPSTDLSQPGRNCGLLNLPKTRNCLLALPAVGQTVFAGCYLFLFIN